MIETAARVRIQDLCQRLASWPPGDAEDAGAAGLSAAVRAELMQAIDCIKRLVPRASAPTTVSLRGLQVGDIGWLTRAQSLYYARELGLNLQFEALVARIAAEFVEQHDAACEGAWIAETGGRPVGSIFLRREDATTARLRLLYVDENARGLGVGRRLVAECVAFARAAGYRQITLWTNGALHAACSLYRASGFVLSHDEEDEAFGVPFRSQTWTLGLQTA